MAVVSSVRRDDETELDRRTQNPYENAFLRAMCFSSSFLSGAGGGLEELPAHKPAKPKTQTPH